MVNKAHRSNICEAHVKAKTHPQELSKMTVNCYTILKVRSFQ